MTARRCVSMSVGAALLIILLVAAGVPGALLLVLVPTLVCVAMPLWMGHRDPGGEHLLETAQRAVRPPQK
jgi:hypothetical protein